MVQNSGTYTHNEDSSAAQGHKWTLKSLWRHFDELGIDHTVVWEKIKVKLVSDTKQ
jgi:tubulin polyglutamylase TTLL4